VPSDPAVAIRSLEKENEAVKIVKHTQPTINFTYSVEWFIVNIEHKERSKFHHVFFFPILETDIAVHWYSILNSLLLVFFLFCVLFAIITRIIKVDMTDPEEESGWRQLHSDIYRVPAKSELLSAMVGVGIQFVSLTIFFLFLALVGIYYTGNDGAMNVSAIVLYALTSIVGGFTSLYWYKKLNGMSWVKHTFLTSALFAAPFFVIFGIIYFFSLVYGVTKAIPATTIIGILALWLILGLPLQVIGSIAGKRLSVPLSKKVRIAPRELPELPYYYRIPACMVISGCLSFSTIFIEVNYINNAIWMRGAYRIWGILGIVTLLLLVVTACTNIVITYLRLCVEEYRWWWSSFLTGGSVGIFSFVYSIYYYFYQTHMFGFLQGGFFFGVQLIFSYFLFLMLGSVGFLSSYFFCP